MDNQRLKDNFLLYWRVCLYFLIFSLISITLNQRNEIKEYEEFSVKVTEELESLNEEANMMRNQIEVLLFQRRNLHETVKEYQRPVYISYDFEYEKPYCELDPDQLSVVKFSYDYGEPYDLGYTLAAISIKESNAGKWNVNVSDPSAGPYHVTLDKVLRHYGWEDNSFNRNRAAQELINNVELAAELAVNELLFWKEKKKGNWQATWASYNAGSKGLNSSRGKQYAEDIRKLIVKIKDCGWEKVDLSYNL